MYKYIIGGIAAAALAVPAVAGISINLEAPGVTNSTQAFTEVGVETFDSYAAGTYTTLNSNFGGSSTYTGTYTGPEIKVNDSWGGAGNSQYVVALGTGASYTLELNKSADYFGFYLAALSSGNMLEFYNGSTLLGSYDYAALQGIITAAGPGYMGSPDAGQTGSEYFAFFNFNFTDGDTYNKVVFSNSGSDGFESDNHTVGINAVPEPATWAMLIAGFGLVGFAARRRRRQSSVTA